MRRERIAIRVRELFRTRHCLGRDQHHRRPAENFQPFRAELAVAGQLVAAEADRVVVVEWVFTRTMSDSISLAARIAFARSCV